MSVTSRVYIFVFLIGVFSILVVMMGFQKILKMIFGNYIITGIIVALGLFIDFEIKYIQSQGLELLGMGSNELSELLSNGKLTLLVAGYILLMLVWYKFSTFNISIPTDEFKKKGFTLLITPICVTGIVLSLLIIILGTKFTNLGRILRAIPDNPSIRNFIMKIPIRIVLHGVSIILIGLQIKLSRRENANFTSSEYN